MGSAIGISIMAATLTSNLQISHADLARWISPFNPNLTAAGFDPNLLTQQAGQQTAAILDGMITQQALMVAYIDDFKLMFLITLAAIPLLLLLRYRPMAAGRPAGPPTAVMAD